MDKLLSNALSAISRLGPVKFLAGGALLLLVASRAASLPAQPPSGQAGAAAQPKAVFRVSVPLVVLDAVVGDPRTKQPVGGLTAADFVVQEDGKPQRITYFGRDEMPLSIVFMFDLTDTVRPVLRTLCSSAEYILGFLKPQDEIAVAVFSSTATIVQAFTTDHKLAAAAIERASEMRSREGTFLNESVYQVALETLKSSTPRHRRAIICLTDGTVNIPSEWMRKFYGRSVPKGQIHTEAEAYRVLFEAGASFNAVIERSALTYLFSPTKFMDPSSLEAWRYPPGHVTKYAAVSGGIVLNSSKRATVQQLVTLLGDLRSRYTLAYTPSDDAPAGSFCRIHLELTPEARARFGNPTVKTRSGYYRYPLPPPQ
jgi:VWFA-related protein